LALAPHFLVGWRATNFLQLSPCSGFLTEAMENKPANSNEPLWRRPLNPAEAAARRGQPEAELEIRLTDALAKVRDVSVPSNFTSRVLNAIELEEHRAARAGWYWNWHRWLPRLAVGTAILLVAGVGIQRYEIHSQRVALAKNIAAVAISQSVPSAEVLENLDAIQRMSQAGRSDGELLAALQ
jgi:hypothetical protein